MSEHKEILAQFLRKLTEFVACFNGPMKLFLMMWSFSQKAKQSNHHHPLPQRTFSPSRVIGNGVLLLNNGGVSEMSWRRLFPQWRNPESGSLVWVKISCVKRSQMVSMTQIIKHQKFPHIWSLWCPKVVGTCFIVFQRECCRLFWVNCNFEGIQNHYTWNLVFVYCKNRSSWVWRQSSLNFAGISEAPHII